MQDVCISFWNGKQAGHGQSDMMLKVTDICSTDPNDPTHCAKPGDIKIDRTKAKIMEQLGPAPLEETPQVMGSQFYDGVSSATSETWWFFTKCWADVCCPCPFATLYPALTWSCKRLLYNLHTAARQTTGSPLLQSLITWTGPRTRPLSNTKTIR